MTSEQHKISRPALPPNEITKFFWDAAKEHKLVLQRCDGCGYYIHWPGVICPRCGSDHLSPAQMSGKGTIFTYTVVHHVFHPIYAADVPYSIAIVELDEQPGLRMLANIIDCPNDALYIGMPVEVTFQDLDSITLPQFRPAPGAKARR
jgi:uncharacterized OB-fold protein